MQAGRQRLGGRDSGAVPAGCPAPAGTCQLGRKGSGCSQSRSTEIIILRQFSRVRG